ncbi:hypothetical protein FA95DRAFT_1675139 [Auriscalpium vulgare]|uniref:Uncharacterized protein n=1 Tax=Auriscalpium vulgare TaxID=40419 RepID=A0ACB8S7E7_9AGAM|nr:hypothetical protein FA95DRAFT_1675139 [Auriscalpium vulgare]
MPSDLRVPVLGTSPRRANPRMPGPSNSHQPAKKKKKAASRASRTTSTSGGKDSVASIQVLLDSIPTKATPDPLIALLEAKALSLLLPPQPHRPRPPDLQQPSPSSPPRPEAFRHTLPHDEGEHGKHDGSADHDAALDPLPAPPLTDPGTGPRVQSLPAFLASSFAHPPSPDPLCAEFAQPEVLQMLQSVLPTETALFAQYNKSRIASRICPACRRLYALGDALPPPLPPADPTADDVGAPEKPSPPSPQLLREQEISGLCSPLCFILALGSSSPASAPTAIDPVLVRASWGRMAEELDDAAWAHLDAALAVASSGRTGGGLGLGLLVAMTRLHDLGLAQLCVPELGLDEEIYRDSGDMMGTHTLGVHDGTMEGVVAAMSAVMVFASSPPSSIG